MFNCRCQFLVGTECERSAPLTPTKLKCTYDTVLLISHDITTINAAAPVDTHTSLQRDIRCLVRLYIIVRKSHTSCVVARCRC
jgi:hypothetical protein